MPVGWVVGGHVGAFKAADDLDEEADDVRGALIRVGWLGRVEPEDVGESACRKQADIFALMLDQPVFPERRRQLPNLCVTRNP
jgi:hypothetical protein